MIKKYKGILGEFQYDDTEFKLKDNCLRYIGTETDGSKIKIPKGIRDCSYMFCNCSSLVEAPEIPAGVTNCYAMFRGCSSLVETPEIPAGVVHCVSMFSGCSSLRNFAPGNFQVYGRPQYIYKLSSYNHGNIRIYDKFLSKKDIYNVLTRKKGAYINVLLCM